MVGGMFIRRSPTRNKASGESYFTFRLVRTERIAGKVKQLTLLNLGRHFPVTPDNWPELCARIEQLIGGQASLLPVELSESLEKLAQRYAAQLVARAAPEPEVAAPAQNTLAPGPGYQEVAVESLELVRPRSVGGEAPRLKRLEEHAALFALAELGLVEVLTELGLNGVQRAAVIGNVIGRMAAPASELATWNWLCTTSALGELLDVDFEGLSHMRLYRASDALVRHREAIEARLFGRVRDLFGLEETITLFDLTNTYFEGEACAQPKAARGRSKEKRSDCPLVTLGLVLDGSGFVRRSQVFEGNAVEARTLETMLKGLQAPLRAMVILDRGIATRANLDWLVENGYRYLVASRDGVRQFDAEQSIEISSAGGDAIRIQKVVSEDDQEVRLYCHSPGREQKETAISARFAERFEAGLKKLAEGLAKPRGEKRIDRLLERIGRLKQKSRGIGQHYQITLEPDADGRQAVSLSWNQQPVAGTMLTDPGVYCLATNETSWDEETLWRTYIMLTDLEAVFRSLKSELGLRPIYHSKAARTEGHLFITVLAYQCVQLLRTRLKAKGIHDSWASLRLILSAQRRVTATFRQRDGRTLNVRKSTVAEPTLLKIYQALGLNPSPGGTRKLIV
jgi:transposase